MRKPHHGLVAAGVRSAPTRRSRHRRRGIPPTRQRPFDSRSSTPRGSNGERRPRVLIEWPVGVTLLLGMSCGLMIAGLCHRSGTEGASRWDPRTVVASAMTALAIGVSFPRRISAWIARTASRTLRAVASAKQDVSNGEVADVSFSWTVVSVLALGCGLAASVTPLLSAWAMALRMSLNSAFLWPFPTGMLLDGLLTLLVCGIPMFLMGAIWCALHHLSCPACHWQSRVTGWALVGAGVPLGFIAATGAVAFPSQLMLVASALPALAIPLLIAAAPHAPRSSVDEPVSAIAPTLRDRWPRLLRAAIVAVGGGAVCAALVWSEQAMTAGDSAFSIAAITTMLLGMGNLLADAARTGSPSMGGLGLYCAVAGLLTAFGILGIGASPDHSAIVRLAPAGVGFFAIGLAMGHGRSLLWARVASRSIAGAAELTRFLLCAAFSVWVTGPLAIRLFGRPATIIMVALSLVAVGGTLVIHDSADSPQRRRRRILLVFACLSLMILLVLLGPAGSGR